MVVTPILNMTQRYELEKVFGEKVVVKPEDILAYWKMYIEDIRMDKPEGYYRLQSNLYTHMNRDETTIDAVTLDRLELAAEEAINSVRTDLLKQNRQILVSVRSYLDDMFMDMFLLCCIFLICVWWMKTSRRSVPTTPHVEGTIVEACHGGRDKGNEIRV